MKHKIFRILSLFLLPVLMGAGCEKEDLEAEAALLMPTEFYKFSDFDGDDSSWHLKGGYANSFYIVNSEEELKKYIVSDCMPEIDFSEYIVILGIKSFASGASLLNETVEENDAELIYTVDFSTDFTMVALGVKYHVVVPMPYNKDIKVVEVVREPVFNQQ